MSSVCLCCILIKTILTFKTNAKLCHLYSFPYSFLTLSAPNFRRQMSSAFFFILTNCLYVKLKDWMSNSVDPDETAHWAVSSGSMMFAKAYYYRLWQWKSWRLALWTKFSTDDKLKCFFFFFFFFFFFLVFPENRFSHSVQMETICMKCQILFSVVCWISSESDKG